jgi:hypothetical protein
MVGSVSGKRFFRRIVQFGIGISVLKVNEFKIYPYQREFLRALESGKKLVWVWNGRVEKTYVLKTLYDELNKKIKIHHADKDKL